MYILLYYVYKIRRMKYPVLLFLLPILLLSCNWRYKTVEGNGNIVTENRKVTKAENIKLSGSFDVIITQAATTSVTIETDENLMEYIDLSESGDQLVLKEKNNTKLKSDHPVRINISTPHLSGVKLAGSGSVLGKGKFTGSNKLVLSIAGSGDISLDVNVPEVTVNIAGSGSLILAGETKNARYEIAGSGNCDALNLKSENTRIKVAGMGDVKVFADELLDVSIAGSGTIYYKGAATVKQKIAGIGSIKKME